MGGFTAGSEAIGVGTSRGLTRAAASGAGIAKGTSTASLSQGEGVTVSAGHSPSARKAYHGRKRRQATPSNAMALNLSREELAFRDEVRAWLAANLPPELTDKVVRYQSLTRDELERWHKILAAKGWIAPAWPREWGGTDWSVV